MGRDTQEIRQWLLIEGMASDVLFLDRFESEEWVVDRKRGPSSARRLLDGLRSFVRGIAPLRGKIETKPAA